MDDEKKVLESEKIKEVSDEKMKLDSEAKDTEVKKDDFPVISKEEFDEMLKEEEKEEPKEEVKPKEIKRYTEISKRPEPRLKKVPGPYLTMFRESVNERETGQLVYKGEDALPFVNENVMLVADGLGGASSIRHVKFERGLFEEDEIYDTLFKDMYGEKNPLLEDYVIDSFGQLIAVRNLYDEVPLSPKNVKKGGYFASRIVSSIFLNQVFNAGKNGNTLYDEVMGFFGSAKVLTKNQYEILQENIARKITDIIHEDLAKISKNANLIYESKYSGVALLGTTLTATIVKENEKDVDAFYFQAGDSIPYVLDKDGLRQIMHDHEGKDGGMTNYIRANDEIFDRPFYIETKYMNFPKPCILFNSSDGCFDSNAFVSPLAFEKLILEAIRDAKDYDGVSEILRAFFLENGHHDDSSTIAMKFLGYETFAEWQEFAKARLAALNEKYFSKMSDLLEVDFGDKLELVKQTNARAIQMLGREFKNNPKVIDYYKEIAYRDALSHFDLTLEEVDSRLIGYKKLALEFMSYNNVECLEEGPKVTPGERTTDPEDVFALITSDPLVAGELTALVDTDHALEDAKALKAIINAYNYYHGLHNQLTDVNKAIEEAPKLLDSDFALKGGLALLDEFVKNEIYTSEEAKALLERVGYSNEDVAELEKKKEKQASLLEEYDVTYESIMGKKE